MLNWHFFITVVGDGELVFLSPSLSFLCLGTAARRSLKAVAPHFLDSGVLGAIRYFRPARSHGAVAAAATGSLALLLHKDWSGFPRGPVGVARTWLDTVWNDLLLRVSQHQARAEEHEECQLHGEHRAPRAPVADTRLHPHAIGVEVQPSSFLTSMCFT